VENGRSQFRFVLNGQKSGCKICEAAFLFSHVPISGSSIIPTLANISIHYTKFQAELRTTIDFGTRWGFHIHEHTMKYTYG